MQFTSQVKWVKNDVVKQKHLSIGFFPPSKMGSLRMFYVIRLLGVWVYWQSALLAGQAWGSHHRRQKNYGLHTIARIHNIACVNCSTGTCFFPKQTENISDNSQISFRRKAGCTLLQKQPREVFYKKEVFKDFTKLTEKQLCRGLFFNKAAGLMSSSTSFKKRLQHRCFSVNFRNLIRT